MHLTSTRSLTGSPAISEENDEKPDHGDGGPSGGFVRFPGVLILGHNNGDDHMTGCHSNGSSDQNGLASQLVNVCDSGKSCEPHSNAYNAGCKKRCGV